METGLKNKPYLGRTVEVDCTMYFFKYNNPP